MQVMTYASLATLFEAVAVEHEDGGVAPEHPLLAGLQIDDDEADILADVNYALSMAAMTAISHFIEDRVIEQGSDGRIFAGFQKLGHIRPQRDRYEALIGRTQGVFLFGAPDRSSPVQGPNVHIIASTAADIQEHWFVVSDSAEFPVVLLARESNAIGGQRVFRGFWSSNPGLVARVVDVLERTLVGVAA